MSQMMVTITPQRRFDDDRNILQRSKLTVALLFLEAVFVALFGVFVRYGPVANPNFNQTGNASRSHFDPDAVDPQVKALHDEDYKRHIPDYYAVYQDIQVMMFVGYGFLATFLHRYGLSGISQNFVLGAMSIQWATLTDGWIRRLRLQHGYYIYVDIRTMVNSDFALCSTLVAFGALMGKVSMLQLAFMGMCQIAIYQANCAMVYDLLLANDPGCSMTVHLFGAIFGLMLSRIIHHKDVEHEASKKESSVYHSDLFAMVGTLFLWTLYPSFNAANAVNEGRIRAIINTYYCLASCVLTSFAISSIVGRERFSMLHVQNATIAGGIAVGTIAEMIIQPWGAVLVGFVTGIVSVLGFQYFTPCLRNKLGLHDTRGVMNVHLIPGLISAFGSILAAGVATKYKYGDGLEEVFKHHNSVGEQAGYQAAALGVTIGTAVVGAIIVGTVMKLPIWDQPRYDDIMDDEAGWASVVDIPGQDPRYSAYSGPHDISMSSKQSAAVTEFSTPKEIP